MFLQVTEFISTILDVLLMI